jgi:SAM-dependent methyltransferase
VFVEEISQLDETCKFQSSRIIRKLNGEQLKLYEYIDDYLREYCEANDLDCGDVLKIKDKFSRHYIKDLNNFEKYGKYPYELKGNKFTLTRIEYDVILIVSFLLEKHRFEIAYWLASQEFEGNILSVGVGPGVELGIIIEYLGCKVTLIGYDLDVNDYVLERYHGAVKKEYFHPDSKRFDTVLLIEIVEHLSNPHALLKDAISVLDKDGQILLTTAIDIPQFDHLYNFKSKQIVKMLGDRGVTCLEFKVVNHIQNVETVSSKNELVIAARVDEK